MKLILASQMKEVSLKVERETFSSFEGVYISHFSPCSRKSQCEGHAKAGNTYLLQEWIIPSFLGQVQPRPIPSWIWPIFPKKSIPFLSNTQLSLALTSLPLGSDIGVSLPPTWNASPRGFQIAYSHDPTDTLHQQKPFILLELTLYKVISLVLYLTNPGSNWGKYLRILPWFRVS